ncbi:HD domain-containing protein [Pseudonocardia thermophila]|uniref:HD domain-containing protein n=1 Tax=Pseudonocardia thermophila TaxID=1848 RepID=A0A1M6PF89_PSETH|nr:HD domain-containing phosphohydrolase [Pseudonocardia thermophila]SHK06567.1 HD domain-containing protein [Pseudonocardia thermophila]
MPSADRRTTFWVALLAWVGCTADSYELAARFGDDVALRAGTYEVELGSPEMLGFLVRRAATVGGPVHRARSVGSLLATRAAEVRTSMVAHCQVTGQLAARLGFDPAVRECLTQTFARWDGRGEPAGLAGEDIALPVRVVHVADLAEVHHRIGGVDGAVAELLRRRGASLDPDVVDALIDHAEPLLDGLPDESSWAELIAADPAPRPLRNAELDRALEAIADFVDLKSPWFTGRSREIADLAAAAATKLGLPEADVQTVRRAGLLQGLGRTGVPNTIWDKPGPLTELERERMQLHAYYTSRVLRRMPALVDVAEVASMVQERLDGSGYHRGISGSAIPMTARVLAAADCYHALTRPRPHRPARSAAQAALDLRAEAAAGRLAPDAVEAVLVSAGHRAHRASVSPAGLTPREIEVLSLVAQAATSRQVAQQLGISPKTVGNHIERIYQKIGVSTRAGAALFAMEHGLVVRSPAP